ncbi:SDR family oxidoreductase [Planctomicrobium sp. SH664]|uniref:SDR family oxidoreductase n=1 Tax=Planctomicrobium sp. SH664 TaxID=3448125 RepID=UPI003F5C6ABC
MSRIRDKVVLITGASSGIGEATARLLAERGARVVLGARRKDRLAAITKELCEQGHTAAAQKLDVTDLASVRSFVEFAATKFGKVDVLVNNAGLMPLSRLDSLKVDEWNRMIDVNIRGVLNGIAAALPLLQQQGHGHVINVSSVAGHRVFPTSSVYSATKFAVLAISEGLRQEVNNLRVTVISPGATDSELANTITEPGAKAFVEAFRKNILPADSIARGIAYAIEQPDEVDVNEIIIRPTASSH